MLDIVRDLEANAKYKEEYALLIREIEAIKIEMEQVESKVKRSMRLLGSLSSERTRWEAGSRTFEMEMSTNRWRRATISRFHGILRFLRSTLS